MFHIRFGFYKCTLILQCRLRYNVIIIGIQPLGRSGQRPELSQATGMALVHCILGKFLGVACHCFPPGTMYGPLIVHLLLVTGTIQARMHLRFQYRRFIQRSSFLSYSGVTECLSLYSEGLKGTTREIQ